MGFRFRKSIKLMPGVRLNISKGGFSTSIGRPGATVNIGKRGVRGTVGLPGTGLSYSDMLVKRDGRGKRTVVEPEVGSAAPSTFSLKAIILGIVIVALVLVGVLFVAGLSSARQSAPAVGTQAAIRSSQPDDRGADATLSGTLSSEEAPTSTSVHVAPGSKCHANPSARGKVVATLGDDTVFSLMDQQAGWSRIVSEDQDCWVASGLVR